MTDAAVKNMTRRMARGEAEALATFYESWFDTMLITARKTNRGEAFCLDVVQDATLKIVDSIRTFETEAELRAWVRRVVLSCAVDRIRSEARRSMRELKYASGKQEAMTIIESIDRLEELKSALNDLPKEDRHLVHLRYSAEMSLAEIGNWFGIGPKAVDSRLRRLRAKLGKKLEVSRHE